jgi:RNA polymerase sigma-70 factor, ECF subfamily
VPDGADRRDVTDTADSVAEVYREHSRAVLATLVRVLGSLDLAEEAMQEAFAVALVRWEAEGIPSNPRGWLVGVGRNKGVDTIRRRRRGAEILASESEATAPVAVWEPDLVRDDQLRLLFTSCHPALPIDARIALALRVVCGLRVEEIARGFGVTPETMKRRITRAKSLIRDQGIPYEVPGRGELAARLAAVLRVIYLVYNEGHSATSGAEHQRRELAGQAVNMARLVTDLLPEPEATGLLALLLFHESRAATRTDAAGDIVPLEEQDRSRWDQERIAEGSVLVARALVSGRWGSYVIQAAIASVHASADSVATTNWTVIVDYYDMLRQLGDSPFLALNQAIAIAMRDGPKAGLTRIDELLAEGSLEHHHLAHAARADLARRAGFHEEARTSYKRALELAKQAPERRFLERRLAEVT